MARKPDDDMDFDFDDMDFDNFGDGGDGGFDDQPKSKPRSPIMQLFGSVSSGIQSNITDPSVQSKYIKEALPVGYQQAFDFAGSTVSTARSLYDNIVKEAKPVIKESKKALRLLMPAVKSVTPKRLGDALEEWSKDDSRVSDNRPDPEESEIAMTLGTIFNTQLDAQREIQQEGEAKQEMRDIAMAKEMRSQGEVLQSIEKGIIKQVSYQDQVTAKVQQKSLELQYRQFFAARKSLDIHQQMLDLSKAAYDTIIKNTALPEVVKVQNSEVAEKLLKEKIFGAVTEPMSSWFRGIGRRITNKSKAKIKDFFSDVGSTISDMVMMGEMVNENIQSQQEMGGGGSLGDMGRDMVGEAAGGGIVKWLAGKIAKPIRKRLEENGKAASTSMALMRFFQDMPGFVNEWAQSDTSQTGFFGNFIDFFKDAVGANVRNDKLQTSAVDHLDQKQFWSLQNSKTLNEVIPGWLSRIEVNTRSAVPAKKMQERMQYSFETANFESIGDIKKKISKKMYNQTDIKSIHENAMKIVNKIDPPDDAGNYKLSKDARKALLNYIVKQAHDRKQFNMGVLAQDTLPAGMDARYHDEIKDVVRDKFDFDVDSRTDAEGRFTNPLGPFKREGGTNQQELKSISDDFAGMQRWFPDMMEKLLKEARLGNAALLKELKLATQGDDGSYDVSYEDYLKYIEDPSSMPAHARGGLLYRAKGGGTGTVGNRVKIRMANRFKQQKGKVSGKGGKTDDLIPAMISNGEYIVNADSVSKPGMLNHLREIDRTGNIPENVPESIADKGNNDYANADMATVEGAVDALKISAKEGIDLTNTLLTDIRDMVKVVSEKKIIALGAPDGSKLMSAGKGALDIAMGVGKNAIDNIKAFNNGVFKTTGALGKGIYGAGKSLFEMGKNYLEDKKNAVKDIYVNGQQKPVMLARDILEGKYFDKLTNKVITCYDDIKGEVVDKDGNIVLAQTDWAKGLHDRTKSILTYLTDSVKGVYNTTGQVAAFIPATIKSTFNYARSIVDGPIDIFVGDETTPRIKKIVFEMGGYFSAKTGKPIRYLSDIDGIIKDKDGAEVIGLADFEKGLFDVNRKPVQGLSNRIKAVLSDATTVPGKVFKFAKDTVDNAVNKVKWVKDTYFNDKTLETNQQRLDENGNPIMGPFIQENRSIVSRIMDKFKSPVSAITEKIKGKEKEDWLIEITDRMDDVYDLLDWRFDMLIKRTGLAVGITEEDGTPPASRRRLGFKGKLKGFKDKAFNKLKSAKDFVMGKFGSLKDKLPSMDSIKGFGNTMKDKITGAGMIASSFVSSKFRGAKEWAGDIINSVTGKIALSYKELKEGNYIDKLTGKVIEKWEDIKGDVTDRWGRLVASATDFKTKFMDEHGKPLKAKFLEKLDSIKEKVSGAFTKISGAATLGKMLAWSKLRSLKEKATDLMVNGIPEIKLKWDNLKAGEYFDEVTGKVIKKWTDIKGAVKDRFNKTVLTLEEFQKGLMDSEGKTIGQRMLSKLSRGLNTAKQFGKGVLGGIKSGLGTAKDFIGDKLKGGVDWVKGFFGKDKDSEGGFNFFGNNKVVDRLDKIYTLLDERMNKPKSVFGDKDGDGDVENSIQDQRARNEAAEAEEAKQGWWSKMLGKLKGDGKEGDKKGMDITDILSKATGFIKGAVGALTTFFSTGIIAKIVGFVTSGKGAIVRGAAMATAAAGGIGAAASAVGGALAAGGTAVAGAVSLPVLATGAVVAATGYGLYKLYQHVNRDEKPLFTYRMAQYGYDVDSTDQISAIAALEKECRSIVSVSDKGATLTRGKNTGDMMKLFGVDIEDGDEVEAWITWFKNRFSPIYLKHCHAMYMLKKKTDLNIGDTELTSKEQLSYLAKVNMSDIKPSPYDTMDSPFTGWTTSEVDLDADDVQDAYEAAIEVVQDNAEKTDSGKTTQKEVQKSLLDKAKDSLSDIGKSIKDKYNSAVNFTSDAIGKGKDLYDKAVNATTNVIESGVKTYDKAVDVTSKGIEKTVNTGKSMYNAAKDLGGGIIKILEQGPGWNTTESSDGSVIKRVGARNWRNNNPGNIEFRKGGFAEKHGAIGTDGRFAIFPTYAAGRKAKEVLIFDAKAYRDLDLMAAIHKYAPPTNNKGQFENDTARYQRTILAAVGVNKRMGDYTDSERQIIMDAMQKVEGYKAGKTTIIKPSTNPIANDGASTTKDVPSVAKPSAVTVTPSNSETAKSKDTPVTKTPTPAPVKTESFDVMGKKQAQEITTKQVEAKRQDDLATTAKTNAAAADILQKQLDTQMRMSQSLTDIKDILIRMEKAKGSVKETSVKQSDNRAREMETLRASEPRVLEKPPVSMSR